MNDLQKAASVHGHPKHTETGLPVTLIRGGTSRGVYLRESDLPSDPEGRTDRILRLFSGTTGLLADGLGGENPVLRKVAIVSPSEPEEDGVPRLRYTFGQVDTTLAALSHANECGNIAAGVPLFGSLHGWCCGPGGSTRTWIDLANTGKKISAEWSGASEGGDPTLRLSFVEPVPSVARVLLLDEPTVSVRTGSGRCVELSVVKALNDYLFVDARSIGLDRPSRVAALNASDYTLLREVEEAVRTRLEFTGPLKMCLVAPIEDRPGALDVLIVYPGEGRLHRSVAVTGGVTLAVAACIEGTAPCRYARLEGRSRLEVVHPGGQLTLEVERSNGSVPSAVTVERTCRLILRGSAY